LPRWQCALKTREVAVPKAYARPWEDCRAIPDPVDYWDAPERSAGLFRLWLVCSVLWAAFWVYSAYYDYRAYEAEWHAPSWEMLLPVDCSTTRGVENTDFERRVGDKIYKAAGIVTKEHPTKGQRILRVAEIGAGPAVGILMIGWAFMWAFSGFRAKI
jgi:hypothetical protein